LCLLNSGHPLSPGSIFVWHPKLLTQLRNATLGFLIVFISSSSQLSQRQFLTSVLVSFFFNQNILIGGKGDDIIIGSQSRDIIVGWEGDDKIYGMGGWDDLYGDGVWKASLEDSLHSINDEGGGARAVARDITEKKKLEAKVVHAQRIDSIGNLAGGVAHDFNNILTSILGSTAIMKRKMRKNVAMYRFVDIIDTAAKRGADLTRQLLTFARKTSVQFRPIIVNEIVEETLQLFERSVEKTITVQSSLTDDVCVMNGDDGQVQQALLNLLINARDALPEGGNIHVTTEQIGVESPPGREASATGRDEHVVIRVSDNGVGMDRPTQQRIFEPFFTTKEQGKGTGLGLAVVYGVVNAHAGSVTVDSRPGKGTQFSLHFPLLAAAQPEKKTDRPQRPLKGSEHILVVDDEEDVGNVILGMLKALGYKATYVTSGKKAVAAYKRGRRYSTILLDLNMPEMTGRETLIQLREYDPSIRVIVSTGYSNKTVELTDLSSSIHAFLYKPYQIDELAETLGPLLHPERSPRS